MKLLARLERSFGEWAIPNIAIYIVGFEGFTFVAGLARPEFLNFLVLDHAHLFAGEWWRLFTMAVMPPATNPLFAGFALLIFFMCATTLENQWGAFRLNLYLLIGYLMSLLAALVPGAVVTNFPLMESVFLAFAWLYPDYELRLFFFFPVKVKWLALLTWISYAVQLAAGNWGARAAVGAGMANFLLFFGVELWQWLRHGAIRQRRQVRGHRLLSRRVADPYEPLHVCTTCGITDKSDPRAEFRYCPQCTGTPCYCIEHIHTHVHR